MRTSTNLPTGNWVAAATWLPVHFLEEIRQKETGSFAFLSYYPNALTDAYSLTCHCGDAMCVSVKTTIIVKRNICSNESTDSN